MDITVASTWTSPSTLHLKCVVRFSGHRGIQFCNVHIPIEALPPELAHHLLELDGVDQERVEQDPLF